MFGLGATEVIVILVLALIFIGPKKLPELAKGLGKGLREFQKAKDDIMTQVNDEASDEKLAEFIREKKVKESEESEELSTAPEEKTAETENKSKEDSTRQS